MKWIHMKFDLLYLCKDLLSAMMNHYFDPISALRCLRVCKRLNSLGDRDLIIEKVLRYRMLLEYQEQYSKLIICPKCQTVLNSKKSLKKHLIKHDTLERSGKKMPVYKTFQERVATCCNTPTSNYTSHRCLIRKTDLCDRRLTASFYPWSEVLCPDKEWYLIDPNYKEKVCESRCKVCKTIYDCYDHFEKCPERSKLIEIYSLKGDRTDEEWDLFMKMTKDDPSYAQREEEFEKEYLEWKKLHNL